MIPILYVAAALHAGFMVAELFPWPMPALLSTVSKTWLATDSPFTPAQQNLVATIVHNAGIYNGILAGGLFWAARQGTSSSDLSQVLLAGALVAGIFGAITMKSWVPLLQAAVGLAGLLLI